MRSSSRISSSSRSRTALTFVITAALGLFVASSAGASQIFVTYNINVNIGLPAFAVPTTFSGPGQVTLKFQNGTPGGHASPGTVKMVSGFANLVASFTVLGDLFTGFQNIIFNPGTIGTATVGGALNLGVTAHVASGILHCTGATCTAAALPASIPVPLTSGTVPMVLLGAGTGFPSLGPHYFTATGAAGTFAGLTLTATVTHSEISRSVPEPTSGAMIGLGLLFSLGIGAGAIRVRR